VHLMALKSPDNCKVTILCLMCFALVLGPLVQGAWTSLEPVILGDLVTKKLSCYCLQLG